MNQAVRINTAKVPPSPERADALPPVTSQPSVVKHAIYVIGENPVTGLAFGLFLLIAVCAIFGPLVVPYDPLATNTDAAYQAPSAAH
jgi:peptide/nickel transport system permease protein